MVAEPAIGHAVREPRLGVKLARVVVQLTRADLKIRDHLQSIFEETACMTLAIGVGAAQSLNGPHSLDQGEQGVGKTWGLCCCSLVRAGEPTVENGGADNSHAVGSLG